MWSSIVFTTIIIIIIIFTIAMTWILCHKCFYSNFLCLFVGCAGKQFLTWDINFLERSEYLQCNEGRRERERERQNWFYWPALLCISYEIMLKQPQLVTQFTINKMIIMNNITVIDWFMLILHRTNETATFLFLISRSLE